MTKRQEALENAQRLTAIVGNSDDAIIGRTRDGIITSWNLIGTSFSDYFTDPEKANAVHQLGFAHGTAVDYPLTMRHRDGTLTEVRYNASVYRNSGGKVLGVFAAARDVTQQNRAQREIAEQRNKELERLAELEQFQRLTVGRELKMIELKKQNEHLRSLIPPDKA